MSSLAQTPFVTSTVILIPIPHILRSRNNIARGVCACSSIRTAKTIIQLVKSSKGLQNAIDCLRQTFVDRFCDSVAFHATLFYTWHLGGATQFVNHLARIYTTTWTVKTRNLLPRHGCRVAEEWLKDRLPRTRRDHTNLQ